MRYRFRDAMGDVVADGEYADHASALDAACADDEPELNEWDIQRVEYLGPDGDWRWAGPLHG